MITIFYFFSVSLAILELDQKQLICSLGSLQKKYEVEKFISLILTALCVHFNINEPEVAGFTIEQILQELELSTEMLSEPCKYVLWDYYIIVISNLNISGIL